MRFAELDAWGLRDSVLHRRDARAKIIATLLILIAASRGSLVFPVLALALALPLARLPLIPVLLRGAVVLPFSVGFAAASWMSGRPDIALFVLLRSYLSALCVIVLLGSTQFPAILEALRRMGAPPLLLDTIQFVYRYLSLIGEQSKRMAIAASARGARRSFTAVAGATGVLFARSYDRAEAVHRSMLARGYSGSLKPRVAAAFSAPDAVLVLASSTILLAALLLKR